MSTPSTAEPTCPSCGRQLVEISLDVGGEDVRMRSCSACDLRSWHTEDGPVAIDGVLQGLRQSSA